MRRVKSTDTAPEMKVRRALHAAGLRYSLHRADLPGKPDVVHGCFFHSHPGCCRARIPATRQDHWIPKLRRNAERDRRNEAALTAAGWRVRIVWECELKDPGRLPALVAEIRARVAATDYGNQGAGVILRPYQPGEAE
jgi:DNA mismatch endonuclease (patch repair protein)